METEGMDKSYADVNKFCYKVNYQLSKNELLRK